ncbi:MAG: hypothetical protein GXY32_10305 [Ruminococcaceae bacterium]|nr:hypothetical protein [Oscillospiraceae bacterium]
MKWLYKLEYKYGRRYIRRLMLIVVIGMVVVYLADVFGASAGMSPLPSTYLMLSRDAILHGQVWRLITFVFVPPGGNAFLLLISLYFYYIMGNMLETYWGGFRLNIYYLFGIVGTWLAMFIVGYGTNSYLNLSLFLAFATIAPDTTFRLFFIIPIKAKWMALAYAALMAIQLIITFITAPLAGLYSLVSLAFSLLNYFLFFGRTLIDEIRNQMRIAQNKRNWRNRNR